MHLSQTRQPLAGSEGRSSAKLLGAMRLRWEHSNIVAIDGALIRRRSKSLQRFARRVIQEIATLRANASCHPRGFWWCPIVGSSPIVGAAIQRTAARSRLRFIERCRTVAIAQRATIAMTRIVNATVLAPISAMMAAAKATIPIVVTATT